MLEGERAVRERQGVLDARVRKYVRSPEVPKPKARPEARIEVGHGI